jgi:beta-glucosidase
MAKKPETPVYLDPARPISERVSDLISQMTLLEKVAQMNHPTEGIPRLNIPPYNYWNEALHGVARNGKATVFPQAIGMAATWDRELIKQVASAIGDEARAKHHETMRRNGYSDWYQGLTFWSPNVNIFRDPRWGRGQETWGEDPFLTGEMGSAFVRGLQGDHPRYMKAAACAKHYAVHSGPERDRHTFNAVVSKRDLYGTYLPAFKKLVTEAKVEAVMGAYNRTLGEPCNASKLLLVDILRGEWGFDGHVVSDCGALTDFHANHKVTQDAAESAALALQAGCDLGCDHVYNYIPEAIERGLMSEADVDRALAHTLTTRFRLGMFDPPRMVPFTSIPMSVVSCKKHRQLAFQTAIESVVLLKNNGNILPLGPEVKSVMVTGPVATSQEVLLGNYYGFNDQMCTFLEGVVGRLPEGVRFEYHPGCLLVHPNAIEKTWAPYMAGDKDVVLAFMGTSPLMEGEEGEALLAPANGDRSEIALPSVQLDFLKQLSMAGAKVILVLTGGSPITLGEAEDMVQAILWVGYPGQEGGRAVAAMIFGDRVPSGKLPISWPKSIDDLPPFEEYDMAGRTYRFSKKEPLYPFGFGLSYTSFMYSNLKARSSIRAGKSLSFSFKVANTGQRIAAEVVQFYLRDIDASVPVPSQQLIGFQRIQLKPGQKKTVKFTITPEMMMFFDDDGKQKLEPGKFCLTVGGCSPSERGIALGAPDPVSIEFDVKA